VSSWEIGRQQIPPGCDWINLGDYHSHPNFGVFMSADDCASFWAWGHLAHWVGCVIDPLREQIGFFVKRSSTSYHKVPGWWVPDELPSSTWQNRPEVAR
jgi:proteasome lid subunit RPN8/RPN11